eukprot:CAMPEP_0172637636 /NCGR_PEP_ID=MMETSP1068-20121228/209954_1 /TAXON_ID=35684 /ORGANISM="Pseudopedinella elastica, Strain CCMP716" /LENGTH=277 /DNA_ID=CAMNT_0013450349 /DNA_START=130 /DNA_END=963 /DNA_ORIENTATION=-
MNVGSNQDPVLGPDKTSNPSHDNLITIAVEPDLRTVERIFSKPKNARARSLGRLHVLPCAVSNISGAAAFRTANYGGQSSSLANPEDSTMAWARREVSTFLVPVLSMRQLLEVVPNNTVIYFLKTDMQGFDFTALGSAGNLLRKKVLYLMHECNYGELNTYHGVRNDLFRDFEPYLRGLGFEPANHKYEKWLEGLRIKNRHILAHPNASHGELTDVDAYWVNTELQKQVDWEPWEGMFEVTEETAEDYVKLKHDSAIKSCEASCVHRAQRGVSYKNH